MPARPAGGTHDDGHLERTLRKEGAPLHTRRCRRERPRDRPTVMPPRERHDAGRGVTARRWWGSGGGSPGRLRRRTATVRCSHSGSKPRTAVTSWEDTSSSESPRTRSPGSAARPDRGAPLRERRRRRAGDATRSSWCFPRRSASRPRWGKPWLAAREAYGCDEPYNTYFAFYRVEGEAAVKSLGPIPYPDSRRGSLALAPLAGVLLHGASIRLTLPCRLWRLISGKTLKPRSKSGTGKPLPVGT